MDFNSVFGVQESYRLPDAIMQALLTNDRKKLMDAAVLLQEMNINDYFQADAGDRDKLKQDFTPKCVCDLVAGLMVPGTFIDECAGTGGLTQAAVQSGKCDSFVAEEISNRAIPFNLLYACVTGMDGFLLETDVLRNETKAKYRIAPVNPFSMVFPVTPEPINAKFTNVIMNPPYSLKFSDTNDFLNDPDFHGFKIPSSKADYGFVLRGLGKMAPDGRLIAILPHGVLFRGQGEAKIRRWLVENHLVSAIIGLPNNLFLNTGIPVCLLVLEKDSPDVLILDSSQEFVKGKKQNDLNANQIQKIVETFQTRKAIKRYSALVPLDQIRKNDYNLNIPRYVDTFVPEPLPDMSVLLAQLEGLDQQETKIREQLYQMLNELTASDPEDRKAVKRYAGLVKPKSKRQPKDTPQGWEQLTFEELG